jgi:hypothetical protein
MAGIYNYGFLPLPIRKGEACVGRTVATGGAANILDESVRGSSRGRRSFVHSAFACGPPQLMHDRSRT